MSNMATETNRRDILNVVVNSTQDNIEYEVSKAESTHEWEAIQQEVKDINTEVQALLLRHVPDQHGRYSVYGVDKNLQGDAVQPLTYGSNSCVDRPTAGTSHQLVTQGNSFNGLSPKTEPPSGILPFFKISSQKIQNLKPTIHIALPKYSTSSVRPTSSSCKQPLSSDVKHCEQVTHTENSFTLETNSFHTVTVICSATLKQNGSNDHDASMSGTMPSLTAMTLQSSEIPSCYKTIDPVQECNPNNKTSAKNMRSESTANVSHISADFSLVDESQILSESTMDGIFNILNADVSTKNISTSETSLSHEIDKNEAMNQNKHTANISHVVADFSLVDESRLLSESTMEGIFNRLDANSTANSEHIDNISCAGTDFSLTDESSLLSESIMDRIFNGLDADVSMENMPVTETSETDKNNGKAMQLLQESVKKANPTESSESTADISHVVADFSLVDESRILSESIMERIFNRLDADVSSENMSVRQASPSTSVISEKYDESLHTLQESNQNTNAGASNEDVVPDFNLTDEKPILSESTPARIFTKLDADVSSKYKLLSGAGNNADTAVSILEHTNHNDHLWNENNIEDLVNERRILLQSSMESNIDGNDLEIGLKSVIGLGDITVPLHESALAPKSHHQLTPGHNSTTSVLKKMNCNGEKHNDIGSMHNVAMVKKPKEKQKGLESLSNIEENKGNMEKQKDVRNLHNMAKDTRNVNIPKDVGRVHKMSKNKSNTENLDGLQSLHKIVKNKRNINKMKSVRGFLYRAQQSIRDESSSLPSLTEEPVTGKLKEKTKWKPIKDVSDATKKAAASKRADEQNCHNTTQAKCRKFVDNVNQYPSESMPTAKKTNKLKFSIDVLLKKICSKQLQQQSQKKDHGDETKPKNPQKSWFVNNPFNGIFRKRSGSLAVNENNYIQPVLACVGKQNFSSAEQMSLGSGCQLLMVSDLQKSRMSQVQECGRSDIDANPSNMFSNNQAASQNETNAVPRWSTIHYSVPKAVNESPVTNDYLLSQSMIASPSLSQVCEPVTKGNSVFEIPVCSLPFCEKTLPAPTLSPIYEPPNRCFTSVVSPSPSMSYSTNNVQGSTLPIYEPLMEEDTLLETAIGSVLVTICPSPATLRSVFSPFCHPTPPPSLSPLRYPTSPASFSTLCDSNQPFMCSSLMDTTTSTSFLPICDILPLLSPVCEPNLSSFSPLIGSSTSSTVSPLMDLTISSTVSPLMDPTGSSVSPLMDLTISSTVSPLMDPTGYSVSPLMDLTISSAVSSLMDPTGSSVSPLMDLTISSTVSPLMDPTPSSTVSPLMDLTPSSTVSPLMDLTPSTCEPLCDSFQSQVSSLCESLLPPLLSPISDLPTFTDYPSVTPPPPHLSPVQGHNNYKNTVSGQSQKTKVQSESNLELRVQEDISHSKRSLNPGSENHLRFPNDILSMTDLTAKIMNRCHKASATTILVKAKPVNQFSISSQSKLSPIIKISSEKVKYLKAIPLKSYMETFVTSPKETLPMSATNFDMNLLEELTSLSGLKENESNERNLKLSSKVKTSVVKSGSHKTNKQRLYSGDKRLPIKSSSCKTKMQKPYCGDERLPIKSSSCKTKMQKPYCGDERLPIKSSSCKTKLQKPYCGDEKLPIKKRYMRFTYQHDVEVMPTAEKQQTLGVLSKQNKKINRHFRKKKRSPPRIATLMNVCQHVNKFMDIPASSISVTCRRSHKPHLIELAKMCYIQVNQTDLCIELKKTSDSRRPTATDLEWLWT